MYYDMQIQGPGLVDPFSDAALKAWSQANAVDPAATACKPKDPRGPDEKTFLYLVNARRQKSMENSTTLYHETTYRPETFEAQLDANNLDLTQDMLANGHPIKGLPKAVSATTP